MPQLNPEFFLSQIFWLVTTFSFLLFFLWRISLPRISQVLEKREIKINEDIKSAKKLQTEAEEIQSKIDQQLNNIYNQTSDLIKKSNTDLQNKILIELETIDKEIKKKINEATINIQKKKNDSLGDINNQIQEITKMTLSKLSNIQVTNQELSDTFKITQNKLVN